MPAIAGNPMSLLPANPPGFPVPPQGLTLVPPCSCPSASPDLATLVMDRLHCQVV